MKVRPIAIYLPQFHPIPENDEWWGKGFTEWTNVTKAKPLFKEHYQPHLPADLGFYDLRVPEVRLQQTTMAAAHGISGFCYYHYWFNGRRILERPFQEVLDSGSPDFPFMLCWANENWSRVWDGGENELLLEQQYSEADDINHIQSMLPAFRDDRYIRINNKPVFAIYRSSSIPNVKRTISTWRAEAKKEGVELYLIRFETFGEVGKIYLEDGFDAAVRFEPHSKNLIDFVKQKRRRAVRNKLSFWYFKYFFSSKLKKSIMWEELGRRIDYAQYVDFSKECEKENYKCFPGVSPMWDNSARRKNNSFIFENSTPDKFEEWLNFEIKRFKPYSQDENLLFINAWNEWAEGNHLEPCQKWGTKYLEAVRKAINNASISNHT